MRLRISTALVVAACIASSSCTVNNLAFRKDHRVKITAPAAQTTVTLPVTLRWDVKSLPTIGQDVSGQAAGFAVFVDRQPMGPGKSFRALADDTCKKTKGCPDPAWLAERHVFTTTNRTLVLNSVPANDKGERYGRGNAHEVTIVLVDARGRRVGEAAFAVDFFLKEKQ
jgi:hypothetical protein